MGVFGGVRAHFQGFESRVLVPNRHEADSLGTRFGDTLASGGGRKSFVTVIVASTAPVSKNTVFPLVHVESPPPALLVISHP